MSSWFGRLKRRDLEGGIWVLHTPQGLFTLVGMNGPEIAVRRVRKAWTAPTGSRLCALVPGIPRARARCRRPYSTRTLDTRSRKSRR